MSQSYLYVFLIVVLIQQSFSFKLSPQVNANGRLNQNSKVSIDNIRYSQRDTALRAFSTTIIESLMQKVDPNLAKGEFFFFFLAGNGALAFGVQLLPKIFKQRLDIQNLKGGVTLGGEDLGFNIFAALSYPESLKVKDIQNIISKIPSTKILQDKGPKKSFIAKSGYIEREAFDVLFPPASFNPVASYAVFDALSSGNGDFVSPEDAEAALARWRGEGGLNSFKTDLTVGLIKKLSSYLVFVGLIALVVDLIVESGLNAFLPGY